MLRPLLILLCFRVGNSFYMLSAKPALYNVVLLRHGQSTFNKSDMFTGWYDCHLCNNGKSEAVAAGQLLKEAGFQFDVAHTSVLQRAVSSLYYLLKGMDAYPPTIPIKKDWRLNERMYGDLQGGSKEAAEAELGDIVKEWRKSYDAQPPPMKTTHPHYKAIHEDPRYEGINIPLSESLADCGVRVVDCWNNDIVPDIKAGKHVLIVGHANALRSLIYELDGMTKEGIRRLKMPTGRPILYQFDENMRPVGNQNELGFRGVFIDTLLKDKEHAQAVIPRRSVLEPEHA